jgi:hypothetical protein
LEERGIDYRDCFEKSDLVEKLNMTRRDNSFGEKNAVSNKGKNVGEKNAASGMKVEEAASLDATEAALREEMYPDQIEILMESEDREDLNGVLSSLGITKLTAKQFVTLRNLRAREIARKRAAGEFVPTSKVGGAPVTLAREDRAACGVRACQTPGCKKHVQIWMGDKGWCKTCCPSAIKIEKNACTHMDDHGVRCTSMKKIAGLCLKHCPDDHPKKIEHARKKFAENAKRRKS